MDGRPSLWNVSLLQFFVNLCILHIKSEELYFLFGSMRIVLPIRKQFFVLQCYLFLCMFYMCVYICFRSMALAAVEHLLIRIIVFNPNQNNEVDLKVC